MQVEQAAPQQQQQQAQPPPLSDAVFGPGSRPEAASTGDVCLALDYLEDPAAHGVTSPEVRQPAPNHLHVMRVTCTLRFSCMSHNRMHLVIHLCVILEAMQVSRNSKC